MVLPSPPSAQGPRLVHLSPAKAGGFPALPTLPDAGGPALGPTCHCGLWPAWSWTECRPGERHWWFKDSGNLVVSNERQQCQKQVYRCDELEQSVVDRCVLFTT